MSDTKFPDESAEYDVEDTPSPEKRKKDKSNDELREKLIDLADRGEIKHTIGYIKKASNTTLEQIMVKYTQDQTKAVNEYFSNAFIMRFSEVMEKTGAVDDGRTQRPQDVVTTLKFS